MIKVVNNSYVSMSLKSKTTFCSFFHKKLCVLLCFSIAGSTSLSVMAAESNTAAETLAQTDITRVGMDMFTTAYDWEIGSALGYNSDALKGIEKKLNAMIPTKIPAFVEACKWCSEFIKPGFGDALATFLKKTHNKTGNVSYFNVAKAYLHEDILKAPLKDDTVRKFDALIQNTVGKIAEQVLNQMNTFRDASGMGLYFDGDTTNSPYDLLDDLRRIDEIFFRKAPSYGDYTNSSKDASALITGQIKQGAWVGGENYQIDLLGDIDESLGGSDDDEGKSSDSAEAWAGDCSEWYCVTVDFIQNTHYFVGGGTQSNNGGGNSSGSSSWSGSSENNNSFQAIFEEGLEWIIKHGDKRNFACKAAPTINQYESNDDAGLKLSEIFTGLGIHVFWKTPPFLLSFIERRLGTKTSDTASSTDWNGKTTQSKQDKATEDALRAAFARNGIDYDHPTNLKSNAKLNFMAAALNEGQHRDVRWIDLSEGEKKGAELYESSLVEKWKWSERLLLHQENADSIKHIEKTFDDLLSRIRMVRDYNDTLNKILKHLKEKPDCTN